MSIPPTDQDEQTRPAPPADDGSVRASVARLVASGKELAEAELAWAKVKGAVLADGLRKCVVMTALALVFLIMSVALLIVSFLIALAPMVGWLVASLIVAGVCIAAAIVCALLARRIFAGLFAGDAP
ncbi:MAG TPA: phage holin family protein [Sphingobium sp.]|nr:phage holin family protein [Sphingobium sp.]